MGASLEAEQRAKAEALRIKKKLESDINELEIALDHANKANSEGQKAIKRYQGTLRDTIQGFEDESRAKQEVMEQVGISERKANALSGEALHLVLYPIPLNGLDYCGIHTIPDANCINNHLNTSEGVGKC